MGRKGKKKAKNKPAAVADIPEDQELAVAGVNADGEDIEAVLAELAVAGDSNESDDDDDGTSSASSTGTVHTRYTCDSIARDKNPKDAIPWAAVQYGTEGGIDGEADANDSIGNIGIFYGNWGKKPKDFNLSRQIDLQLRHQPAQILCLGEAQEHTAQLLRLPPTAR